MQPLSGQLVEVWLPCDRCDGLLPGVDDEGREIPGPPVKLVDDEYRCGPCRGLNTADVPRALVGNGWIKGATRRKTVPTRAAA